MKNKKCIAKVDKVTTNGNTIEIELSRPIKKHPCKGCKKRETLCSIHPCIKVIKWFFGE